MTVEMFGISVFSAMIGVALGVWATNCWYRRAMDGLIKLEGYQETNFVVPHADKDGFNASIDGGENIYSVRFAVDGPKVSPPFRMNESVERS